jgi:hypothetical protein
VRGRYHAVQNNLSRDSQLDLESDLIEFSENFEHKITRTRGLSKLIVQSLPDFERLRSKYAARIPSTVMESTDSDVVLLTLSDLREAWTCRRQAVYSTVACFVLRSTWAACKTVIFVGTEFLENQN